MYFFIVFRRKIAAIWFDWIFGNVFPIWSGRIYNLNSFRFWFDFSDEARGNELHRLICENIAKQSNIHTNTITMKTECYNEIFACNRTITRLQNVIQRALCSRAPSKYANVTENNHSAGKTVCFQPIPNIINGYFHFCLFYRRVYEKCCTFFSPFSTIEFCNNEEKPQFEAKYHHNWISLHKMFALKTKCI